MVRWLAVALLLGWGGIAPCQTSSAPANPARNTPSESFPAVKGTTAGLPALPPPPKGRATVIGGAIRNVDAVRDQITLDVFGEKKPMKILFDARTQFFRNGKKIPVSQMRPGEHASVETVLDGTSIFALSVHTLTHTPEGQLRGQVENYDPGARDLTIRPTMSSEPIELSVPPGTPVVRVGQVANAANSGQSDLVKGALISVQFQSGNAKRGIARRIEVLAVPGSTFVFSGDLTFLDLHSHVLAVTDPRDGSSYRISFDPARFPNSGNLHLGDKVRVTTEFDGTHYLASAISIR